MGAWVAHSVECPTLDFGSGHGLRVIGSSPVLGSAFDMEPAWDSLSPSFPLPLPLLWSHSCSLFLSLSLSQKKKKKKRKEKRPIVRLLEWKNGRSHWWLYGALGWTFSPPHQSWKVKYNPSVLAHNQPHTIWPKTEIKKVCITSQGSAHTKNLFCTFSWRVFVCLFVCLFVCWAEVNWPIHLIWSEPHPHFDRYLVACNRDTTYPNSPVPSPLKKKKSFVCLFSHEKGSGVGESIMGGAASWQQESRLLPAFRPTVLSVWLVSSSFKDRYFISRYVSVFPEGRSREDKGLRIKGKRCMNFVTSFLRASHSLISH